MEEEKAGPNPQPEAALQHQLQVEPSPPLEVGPSRLLEAGPSPPLEVGPSRKFEAGPSPPLDVGPSRQLEAGPCPPLEVGPSRQLEAGPRPQLQAGTSHQQEAGTNRQTEAGPSRQPEAGTIRQPKAGPSRQFEAWESEDEIEDFSSDSSSWVPSDYDDDDDEDDMSEDSDTYTCRVKQNNKKTTISMDIYKALPVRRYSPNPPKENDVNVEGISLRVLRNLIAAVVALMNLIREIRQESVRCNSNDVPRLMHQINGSVIPKSIEEFLKEDAEEHPEQEEFNRSDDNVLISNKFTNRPAANTQVLTSNRFNQTAPANRKVFKSKKINKTAPANTDQNNLSREWVPIGSGKTFIHKDKFKKVKWDSYTHATRTLLVAYFSRRVLATHSLTGKKSPAFQDKPAKMCLDPKAVSDIVYEVMDRFHVKENLVRSIITTKCADETKMMKTRIEKLKKNRKQAKNNENLSPATAKAIEDFGKQIDKKEEL